MKDKLTKEDVAKLKELKARILKDKKLIKK